MLDLATFQRGLRDLIKDRDTSPFTDDPYLQNVATSPGLDVIQEITVFWRAVGIERACPLTATLLKRRQYFDAAVKNYIRHNVISPYVDEMVPAFLAIQGNHDDPLIRSMARFELALIRVKRGDHTPYVVDWHLHPHAVLRAVVSGEQIDESPSSPHRGMFRVVISSELPDRFVVLTSQSPRV